MPWRKYSGRGISPTDESVQPRKAHPYGNERFILKYISQPEVDEVLDLCHGIQGCPYIRTPLEKICGQPVLVYKYFSDHLLHFVQEDLPIALTKRILKDTLMGLAALHDKDIVHTDIKPDNILVERSQVHQSLSALQVQVADLESAARVPPNANIVGLQAGNWMWRSPEAHASGPVNKPSDMYSFGLVCIYAVHKRVIFAVGDEELAEGEDKLLCVLERHVSYFAELDGLHAFLEHIGNGAWYERFVTIASGFNKDNPRKPFRLWEGVDPVLQDFVVGLCDFDPAKRLTAHQALKHGWFEGV